MANADAAGPAAKLGQHDCWADAENGKAEQAMGAGLLRKRAELERRRAGRVKALLGHAEKKKGESRVGLTSLG